MKHAKSIEAQAVDTARGPRSADFVLAVALALCTATGSRITFSNVNNGADLTYIAPMGVGTLLMFVGTLLATLACTNLVRRNLPHIESAIIEPGSTPTSKSLIVPALLMLVCWSPYLLALYPGVVLPDALSSLRQVFGDSPYSNHHPLSFTLLLGLFVNAPIPVSVSAKIFLFSLFQTALLICAATGSLAWLRMRGLRTTPYLACTAFFCLCPVFPIYAMNVQKDVLYTVFCLALSICLVEWEGKPAQFVPTLAAFVLVSAFRSNGVMVSFVCGAILLAVTVKRGVSTHMTAALTASYVILYAAISLAIGAVATPPSRAEALGIPLQQIARTVTYDGNISQEDRAFLNRLMPLEEWPERYTPALVDSIKWAESFDAGYLAGHTKEFLAVWSRCLIPNFGTYVDAYVLETFGFWAPGFRNRYGYMDDRVHENNFGIERRDLAQELFGGNVAANLVEHRWFIGSGTLLWLVLGGLWLTVMRQNWRMMLLYTPALVSFMSILIATPVAFSLRYVFVFALGLPMYLLAGFCQE